MNGFSKLKRMQFLMTPKGGTGGGTSAAEVSASGVLNARIHEEHLGEFAVWCMNMFNDEDQPHPPKTREAWYSQCCDSMPRNPDEPINETDHFMCGKCGEMSRFYQEGK